MPNMYFTITIFVGIALYVLLLKLRKQEQDDDQIFDNSIHLYPVRSPARGIICGAIICIPFWLIVIMLINAGVLAVKTLILVGFALSVLLTFLVLVTSPKNKRAKQDRDIIITDSPTSAVQQKTHPRDSLETNTLEKDRQFFDL
ncbi:MAG: hypothetical protein OET63_18895 [Desulfobacterales bacterium]|jgi:apolipoprotein N-acyltransferase|nr:hypothetical protein [Desulfobacterales bacterium]